MDGRDNPESIKQFLIYENISSCIVLLRVSQILTTVYEQHRGSSSLQVVCVETVLAMYYVFNILYYVHSYVSWLAGSPIWHTSFASGTIQLSCTKYTQGTVTCLLFNMTSLVKFLLMSLFLVSWIFPWMHLSYEICNDHPSLPDRS